jgi:endonuclease/exonuclease/phosphatase family metal-dependent hydrolase
MIRTFVVMLLLSVLGDQGYGQNMDTVRIISYNIWNGFDWGKDTGRAENFQDWMKEKDSDVAALQELCGYTHQRLKEEASNWAHSHVALLKTTGYSVGLSSKYPIEIIEKITKGMHHGAIHCRTMGIDFLVVHLHPGSIERRREEMQILIKKIEEISRSTEKLMVLGDFNAHSPFDAHLYDPDGYLLKRLRDNNKEKKGLSGNLVNQDLDYAVISGFLSCPLNDVLRNFTSTIQERGSFPARSLMPLNSESEVEIMARMERIDYILVSEELAPACISAKIFNGEENWYLSDHYPVFAEFLLD